jgi:hypothetical protein
MRKSLDLLAILAAGLVAVAARAETRDGVHQGAGLLIRSEIAVQAVAAAHAPNQNAGSGSRVNSVVVSTMRAKNSTTIGASKQALILERYGSPDGCLRS